MPETYDLIVRGGEVINHAGRGLADVGVRAGKIVDIGDLAHASAGEVFDATGLTVMPGVIDTQVHFREPGMEWKEDLETGSRAAGLGGVTAVFEMPNTEPTPTDPDALSDKLGRAAGRMHCDHAFYVGGTHENADFLGELERLPGCCGIKVFMGASTGSLLVQDDAGVEQVLSHVNRRAAFHSEDEYRLAERRPLARTGDWTSHPEVRDAQSAIQSTERLGGRAPPPAPREAGLPAGLGRGLVEGVPDVLGSDHAPHPLEEKARPYPASPSGMPGVQTLVPVMLNHVAHGRLTLERFVDLTSAGAQRVFQIAGKGRMAKGWDGDLTLVDLKAKRVLKHADMATRSGWTPFDGMDITGWPGPTIGRGPV